MRSKKILQLKQLDKKLLAFRSADAVGLPSKGWLNNIRTSLNMTLEQLGHKLRMSKQGVVKLEQREQQGGITLNSLKEAGLALDMKLVYGFVPIHISVEKMVENKARALASKIVMRTHHNMVLEDQGNSEEQIKKAIEELTTEIKNEMRRSIWD